MSYYTPTDVPAFGLARSDVLDQNFTAIETAFNLIPSDTDIKTGKVNYAVDTGAANAYVVTLPYAPASYSDGLEVVFRTSNANTGASTINANSLGIKAIVHTDGSDVVANDITGVCSLRYDGNLGKFVLINASAAAIAASTSAAASAASAAASAASASASAVNVTSYAVKRFDIERAIRNGRQYKFS